MLCEIKIELFLNITKGSAPFSLNIFSLFNVIEIFSNAIQLIVWDWQFVKNLANSEPLDMKRRLGLDDASMVNDNSKIPIGLKTNNVQLHKNDISSLDLLFDFVKYSRNKFLND